MRLFPWTFNNKKEENREEPKTQDVAKLPARISKNLSSRRDSLYEWGKQSGDV